MRYRETQPSVQSKHFIQAIWTLEHDGIGALPQRVVPDGHPELILNLGEPFEAFTQGEWRRQPRCFFAGQIAGPLLLRPTGPAQILGIRFHPDGAAHIWAAPMDELVGRFTPVADLSPNLDRALTRDPSPHAAEAALLSMSRNARPDHLVAEAVRRISLTRGTSTLTELAGDLGLGIRQFERRFRTAVGLPPKLFCRIQRFANVFHVLETENAHWVDAALSGGYYDQAHLIRDFKDFSGETPAVLLAPDAGLARHFIARFGMSHSYNTGAADIR